MQILFLKKSWKSKLWKKNVAPLKIRMNYVENIGNKSTINQLKTERERHTHTPAQEDQPPQHRPVPAVRWSGPQWGLPAGPSSATSACTWAARWERGIKTWWCCGGSSPGCLLAPPTEADPCLEGIKKKKKKDKTRRERCFLRFFNCHSFGSEAVGPLGIRSASSLPQMSCLSGARRTRHRVPLDWINTLHGREGGRRHVSGDLCAAQNNSDGSSFHLNGKGVGVGGQHYGMSYIHQHYNRQAGDITFMSVAFEAIPFIWWVVWLASVLHDHQFCSHLFVDSHPKSINWLKAKIIIL